MIIIYEYIEAIKCLEGKSDDSLLDLAICFLLFNAYYRMNRLKSSVLYIIMLIMSEQKLLGRTISLSKWPNKQLWIFDCTMIVTTWNWWVSCMIQITVYNYKLFHLSYAKPINLEKSILDERLLFRKCRVTVLL